MTNDRIEELLAKFLDGDISADEKAELEQWLASDQRHNIFQFVHKEEWVKKGIAELDKIDVDSGYEKFVNKYQSQDQDTGPFDTPAPAQSRRRWLRIAVAAAAVFIVSLGSWYYFFRNVPPLQAKDDPANRYLNDIAPGGNVATLQLADGRTIRLDQSANGLLADEGEATIQKTAEDKLEYSTSKVANKGADLFNTISTPSGGQYRVVLPDGSKVWLNAASSIRFPLSFTGSERRVTVSGEAFFDVVQVKKGQTKIPFIVNIQQAAGTTGEVQVLGTRFNVNAYNDEATVRTTLLHGKVRIVPASQPGQAKLIQPGQQADYNNKGDVAINTPDTSSTVAWREGKFIFQNEPIQGIMRQLSRWYDVKIVFKDNIDARFVATFPRNIQLSEMLKILEKTNIVRFAIDGKTVTVMR
ncbi:FecR domain-containing protein [Pseudoflavitalea rhizosphaerae]|uniref:FecR domain-containing protein n=1 Tax=Pseudoflavitalea rhizosphaerae TaxID=1884793 RepID=UPI000F8D3247|nr:FecR domain-containing protein [Pseudoflavitalea rhizosphaerae]